MRTDKLIIARFWFNGSIKRKTRSKAINSPIYALNCVVEPIYINIINVFVDTAIVIRLFRAEVFVKYDK
jgi:hypothetical protein